MAREFIIAHDLGTTGNKASLYNREGQMLASSFHGYRTEIPRVNWVEQNPSDWWQAVCVSTRQLLASAKVTPAEVACVAFSGQMMGAVAVDREARPLRNAIIWADMRAEDEAQRIIDGVGWEQAYRITGHRASSSYSGAKILWVREHEPEIFAQTHKFLHAKDFIVAGLTGQFVTEPTDASGMNLYDLLAGDWSAEILDAIGLDVALLPELHASTDVVGEVTPAAAEETGLAPGTPVVIGGGDGMCAAVGAGVIAEGSAYNYIGSSSWIALTTAAPILDPGLRTFTWAHMVPGMFSPCGTMQAAGGSYQWARDTFCLPEVDAATRLGLSPYELMNLQVESSPPGANGLLFLPYLLGERSPRWNPKARGAYIGLTMKHTRADLVRATLEGITLNLRIILEAFEQQGARVDAIRVIGGGARGRTWRQIMADIYGMPVLRPALLEEATSLGAAVAGGVGVGIFRDFGIAEQLTPIVERTEPDLALRPLYDRLSAAFNEAYDRLAPLYDTLAEFQASD
jgi:xylulokinase